MALNPATREPQKLTAGDTISFLKALGDFPAGEDWALEYEVSGLNGNYTFASTASGNGHQLTVPAATTAAWVPGEYELTGFAKNAGTGERAQIYQAQFIISPNVDAGDGPQLTHAQKMIAFIESVQLGKAQHDILESDVEGTRIRRLSPKELREEYNYWKDIRAGEIDAERAAAGLPSKNKILPRFQITGGFNVPIAGRGWPFQ